MTVVRFLKPLGILAIGLVLGGTVVAGAVQTVTVTTPVRLCVSSRGLARVVSPTATCAKGENPVDVASWADVAALAVRVDASEAQLDAVEAAVGALGSQADATDTRLDATNEVVAGLGADNAALESRVAATEAAIAEINERLDQPVAPAHLTAIATAVPDDENPNPESPAFRITVFGDGLKPGSAVNAHWPKLAMEFEMGTVDADGHFSWTTMVWNCADGVAFFSGTAAEPANAPVNGVVSEVVTGPNC